MFSMIFLFCLFSQETGFDVVVYGGTSAGVTAAVQASRMDKSVVLIAQGSYLGGLSSGGLGATDIGNKNAIGGLSREFYHRVWRYYQNKDAWKWEAPKEYKAGLRWVKDQAWWKFEPHVAEKVFNDLISESRVPVVFNEHLSQVIKIQNRISKIRMKSGRSFKGRVFIDATYEGDLMARAGVTYTLGRESNDQYDETLNGVQTRMDKYHQFEVPVDPYRVKGDPSSGLLPRIHDQGPGQEGDGDKRIQAYNFRMCLTDVKENQVPFEKPKGYDPLQYELLARHLQGGGREAFHHPNLMPNRKTDTNNRGAFSTDNIGMNYQWPEGDFEIRAKIKKEHEEYQKGFMWFLSNDPRVPKKIQDKVNRWALSKDEFLDNNHWPRELYVREARRMVSSYVMTEHNCRGTRVIEDSVGMGAYGMDSHHTQRYVDEKGFARNEGDVQVHGFKPYPISFRSIVPLKKECENLVVPICLSASHIAFGSIRMEPVFMVLGQSATTAAVLALDENTPVQEVDYSKLKERLVQDKQVLFLD